MRRLIAAAAILGLGACDSTASERPAMTSGVGGAHIVLPVVPGRPGVLYFVLGSDPRYASVSDVQRLRRVAVAGVGRTELHQSMDMGAMTQMRPLDSVPLSTGVTRFCPGGLHVMLFDISPALQPGGTARIQLDFGVGEPLRTNAAVVAFGQAPPRGESIDCATKT